MNITLAQKVGRDQLIGGPMVLSVGGTGPPGPHGGCAYANEAVSTEVRQAICRLEKYEKSTLFSSLYLLVSCDNSKC